MSIPRLIDVINAGQSEADKWQRAIAEWATKVAETWGVCDDEGFERALCGLRHALAAYDAVRSTATNTVKETK
jgi:hypothetical protein